MTSDWLSFATEPSASTWMRDREPSPLLGPCPICERPMYDDGRSVNRHHFIPKSRGGTEQEYCHRICHDMLHRTWSEKELEREFSDPEVIRQDPRMQTFIRWVQTKEPTFYARSKPTRDRKRR